MNLTDSGSPPVSTPLFLPATEIGPPRLSTPVRLCLALWLCRFSEVYKYATSMVPIFLCQHILNCPLTPERHPQPASSCGLSHHDFDHLYRRGPSTWNFVYGSLGQAFGTKCLVSGSYGDRRCFEDRCFVCGRQACCGSSYGWVRLPYEYHRYFYTILISM